MYERLDYVFRFYQLLASHSTKSTIERTYYAFSEGSDMKHAISIIITNSKRGPVDTLVLC